MKQINRLRSFERYLLYVGKTLWIILIAFFLIRFLIISPGRINGRSMEPSFKDNEFFLVNKFIYLFSKPDRQDIVQIIDPINKKLLLKRVIGLAGEQVIIKRGRIFIQSSDEQIEVLDESDYLDENVYTAISKSAEGASFNVGVGEYFVLGDNRLNSSDSRDYGAIDRSNIVGRVVSFGNK